MIIVEDTTNPSSKATCINSLLMWLHEDVQRTAWIANAGQEPCSRDIERSNSQVPPASTTLRTAA